MAEFVPIGGSGKAGVCGASVVCGVMTCGVEVPVKLPMPSAEHVAIGAIHAIMSAVHLKGLFVMVSSLSTNGARGGRDKGLVAVSVVMTRSRQNRLVLFPPQRLIRT
jgi:hypothetical protein